jgi:hypothetical protein
LGLLDAGSRDGGGFFFRLEQLKKSFGGVGEGDRFFAAGEAKALG